MLIRCTKKLLDELKIKPNLELEEEPLFSWHANLLNINHRKTVVLANDSSRYIVVLYGLKAKDFKKLDEIIINSIRETFLDECIKEDIVKQYINHSPGVYFTRTKDKSSVAKLNKACDEVQFYSNNLNADFINQSEINLKASTFSIGDGKGTYIYPNEIMYNDLENYSKKSIFSCKSVELKITLDISNHKVVRRVFVPLHINFKQLHNIIQILFSWQDYHLHEFIIQNKNKPIVKLVCNEDAFEFPDDITRILEYNIKLSEYIPQYNKIVYTYDFGDNWQHIIDVGKINEEYGWNYPVCILGEGNAPPEDVGGEYGYDELLRIISDPSDPDYEGMINWSKMQRYSDFDIEFVNRRLKFILKNKWDR